MAQVSSGCHLALGHSPMKEVPRKWKSPATYVPGESDKKVTSNFVFYVWPL